MGHNRLLCAVKLIMSFLLSGPVLFLEDGDLAALMIEFSDRVRRDPLVRPSLDRLIGNRWADAETAATTFFHAALFADRCPDVDANWLARAARELSPEDVDRLADQLLDCTLAAFPLHSAAIVCEIATEFVRLFRAIMVVDGVDRQRRLLDLHRRLASGALLSGF